jgi:predicted phage-related endonuclease
MTRKEVKQAIIARENGIWNDICLLKVGPLLADTKADVSYIKSLEAKNDLQN